MAHTKHDCTYLIVFCPKYRKKIVYGKFKIQLSNILIEILKQIQFRIPPSLAVSSIVGKLKGRSAIVLYNRHSTRRTSVGNKHFWSLGFFVRTTGLDIDMINNYIRNQVDDDIQEYGNQLDMNS